MHDHRRRVNGRQSVNRGFQNHRASRASHGNGLREAFPRSSGIDGETVARLRELPRRRHRDPARSGNAKLFRMTSEEADVRAVRVQHLGDQKTKFSVAQNRDPAPRGIFT